MTARALYSYRERQAFVMKQNFVQILLLTFVKDNFSVYVLISPQIRRVCVTHLFPALTKLCGQFV